MADALARLFAVAALIATLVGVSATARADVVDEAFAKGVAAAQSRDWTQAVADFTEAETLLPGRSAVLSYNLGTAHAHLGEYGRATFHLRRALQPEAGPTADVAEAVRRNLGIVRQRVEVAANTSGAQTGRPDGGWDLVLAAVRGAGVGWLALGSGWLACGLWWYSRWRRSRAGESEPGRAAAGVVGSVVVVLMMIFVIVGTLHGLAVRAEQTSPPAIVLDAEVAAREAPGSHRKQLFAIQGGSQVRIVDRTRDWCLVRLAGGLEGWVPEATVGELSGGGPRRLARARSRPAPDS